MVVEYRNKRYEGIEKIFFDTSNELGTCIHMAKDVILIGTVTEVRTEIITLEGISLNELKITNR